MAPKFIRSFFLVSIVLSLLSALVPSGSVYAMAAEANVPSLPSLETFAELVKSGQAGELRGIYIHDVLAAPIVRQPKGLEEFVSPWHNIVTQFGLASNYGSIGLLAHNYLAGEQFALLEPGQEIHLIYGDGQIYSFTVSEVLHYQALDPASTSSSFVNLDNQESLTYSDLFTKIYNRPGQVIFQTCISAGEDFAWGRLFVIAEPSSW